MGETPPPSENLDAGRLLLIVVGAHLRAEVGDRPLAYRLAEAMRQWIEQQQGALSLPLVPVVCCDIWYLNQDALQHWPTISLGGPGVNALSAYFAQKLSPALMEDDQLVIQLDPEFVDLRACVWGRDHQRTVQAADHFITHYLDKYLRAVATQVEPRES